MLKQVGKDYFEKFVFHLILLEINKLCSLKPDEFFVGQFSKFCNEKVIQIWYKLFRHIWGQWRYENDIKNYHGPKFILENDIK